MKPFTPIIETRKPNETDRIILSTSIDRQLLFLDVYDEGIGTYHASIFMDRKTAKWLKKQLKKALKQPKEDVV